MNTLILKKSSVTNYFVGVRTGQEEVMQLKFHEPFAFRKKGENGPSLSGAYIYTDTTINVVHMEFQPLPKYTLMFEDGQLIRITDGNDVDVVQLVIPLDADLIRFISVVKEFVRDVSYKPVVE